MADRKKFRTLLVKFGNIFVDEQFLWLRFLLCEALEHVALVADNDDIAINLLSKIVTNGKLKINDVSLLRKIAELVNIQDAKDLISDYIENVPQVQPEYRLSAERAAFFNAIMAFDRQKSTDKKKVIGYYELRRKFDTEWDLVLHLEMNQWATMSWQEISKDIFHLINGKAQKCLASVGLAPREDAEAGGAGPGDDAAKADMGRNSPDTVVARTRKPTRRMKQKFRDFLVKLSGDFSGIRVLWLRCLLYDHIDIGELARKTIDGIGLFNKLADRDEISCNDVDLLSEIAELTKEKSAISDVNAYKKAIKMYIPITKRKILTQYRKNLFRALKLVEEDKLEFLASSYQQDYKEFKNIWDLVFFLETDEQLEEKPDKIRRFGNLLNKKAKRAFLDGLDTSSRKRKVSDMLATSSGKKKDGLDKREVISSKRKKGEQSTASSSSSSSDDPDSSDDNSLA